ncbi:MAG: NAD(P)H-binding protein [Actinobacteria bacterium]|nr:NAD(P)H-binding protein [Actinomycetota bacterium]
MKLLVFGAAGSIGKLVVQQALQRGHQVTAFVYGDHSKADSAENLTYFQGDATDSSAVDKVMPGHDAVICVLGHSKQTPLEMQSNATRVIARAMKQHNISRIVSLTGVGVLTTGDKLTLFDRFTTALLLFLQPKRIQDGIKHVEVLKDSSLDWIVLRTPKHRNARQITDYSLTPTIEKFSYSVSRQNVGAAGIISVQCFGWYKFEQVTTTEHLFAGVRQISSTPAKDDKTKNKNNNRKPKQNSPHSTRSWAYSVRWR